MTSTRVPFFDYHGAPAGEVVVPGGTIIHQRGRLSYQPATGIYWKGAGCPYRGHFSLHPADDEIVLGKTPIFYIGYHVGAAAYRDKTGVFRRRYQPLFSDPVGGCGPKENRITDPRRIDLPFVAAQPVAALETPWTDTTIYGVRYRGGRRPFSGCYRRLLFLLEQMLQAGWNFYWDKNAFTDINSLGLVTDSADLFESQDPIHQYGTIYALLYSTLHTDSNSYTPIARDFGDETATLIEMPAVAYRLLASLLGNNPWPGITRRSLIRDILVAGRTCAGAESLDNNQAARQFYRQALGGPAVATQE